MNNDFEYRKYRPGDEAGIVALLKKSFPNWQRRSVDFWRWKYLNSPLGQYVYVAVDGDKLIGTVCDVPIRMKIGDQQILGIYSDDTAIDPDYRGRGIYSKLDRFSRVSKKDMEYFNYWETENPIVTKVASQYSDIPFPFRLCRMMKIKDVDKYLKSSGRDTLTNKLGFTLLRGSNSLVNLTSASGKAKQDFSIGEVGDFDDKIDVFWDRVKNDYNFIVEKKRDYLNWKYCSYDSQDHHIRLATKGAEILGYSVLQYREHEEGSEGSIRDLLALSDRPDVAGSLIDDALERCELLGANSVYSQTIRGHPYQRLLARRGFVDVTRAARARLLYYNFRNRPGFDPGTISGYSPGSIYFNFF